MARSTFIMLGTHHLSLVPETVHFPKKETPSLLPPSLQPLATLHLLSVSVDLPIQDISYKWNHTVCAPLYLASLT
jgi:hypothetical protein